MMTISWQTSTSNKSNQHQTAKSENCGKKKNVKIDFFAKLAQKFRIIFI